MEIINVLRNEMETEAGLTRKMLSLVPENKFDWQPHPKSMSIKRLSSHLAEIPGWVAVTAYTDELDFAKRPYQPVEVKSSGDLMSFFETSLEEGIKSLFDVTVKDLDKSWTLRNGTNVLSTSSKGEVIRMCYNQIVHHRAQLGVYLRLLNIPIPGSYGPSADELSF